MEKAFSTFIEQSNLFTKKDSLLVAVSGGIDSVVLTHLLNKCRYQFSIAHCNFKLRGNSSDEDAQFVQQLALEFNCSFHTIEFDTKEYAKTNKLSVQIAARELRYQWFNELCKEHHLDYILTAHHLNDSVETLLYNLIKGSGIKGLHGIPLRQCYHYFLLQNRIFYLLQRKIILAIEKIFPIKKINMPAI